MPDRYHTRQEPSALAAEELLAIAGGARGTPLFYWERPAEETTVLALGVAWEFSAAGHERFAEASRAATAVLDELGRSTDGRFGPFVVGGFGFSGVHSRARQWRELPPARLWLPEMLWVRRGEACRLTTVWRGGEEADHQRRLRHVVAAGRVTRGVAGGSAAERIGFDGGEDRRFHGRVEAACRRIAAGELEKVVLARSRVLRLEPPADPVAILAAARDRRRSCFNFWIGGREAAFVGSSPERLVALDGDRFVSGALAGSAPRGRGRSEDAELGERLLACPKNRREHELVVAEVRSALASVAVRLEVGERPSLLRLPEAQHLSTAISGRLADRRTVLDLAGLLHPTPAVCGVPREVAFALIDREEPGRGWFTGLVGWMAADGSGELAVALRCLLIDGADATVWAGAGIVEGSDAEAEFLETEIKMNALFAALRADTDERAA